MAIRFFPAVTAELLFTERCNMGCKYCFEPDKQQLKMTKEQINDFVDTLASTEINMFGGEPFLDLDLFIDLYEAIQAKEINETQKNQLLASFSSKGGLITNGTLIKKHLDVIKKYKIPLQISIDGPKEINDLNRVYLDGRGTFDDAMEAIDICEANDIPWSFHGALTDVSFKYLPEIFDFYWDLSKRKFKNNLDQAIDSQAQNIFQIAFEPNYTDESIDEFLQGQEKIFNKILQLPELNKDQKIRFLQGWFARKGATCSAGSAMLATDSELNVYPCHRLAMKTNKKENSLGNLKDRGAFKYKVLNNFMEVAKSNVMYSAVLVNDGWKGARYQQNWCPAANLETSGSAMYQSAKYNVLIAEYTRFIQELFTYAGIPLPSTN